VQEKLKTILTTRCTEDKWPAAVINCYATNATDMASMKSAASRCLPIKQQKLMGEFARVMMGAAGGGGPMHGAGAPAGAAPAGAGSAN
jgi:hypothetical protein